MLRDESLFFLLAIWFGFLLVVGCGAEAKPEIKAKEKKVVVPESEFTLLHKIQGRWQDNSTPEAVIEVVGKKMLWVYQEVVLSEKEIEAHEELPTICHGAPAPGGMGFFIAYQNNKGYCYQIMTIKDNIFDYRPLGPVKEDI